MKGVIILGTKKVEVRELPKPDPGYGQVLVRAIEVGICGSDLHMYRREDLKNPLHVQGHELTGIIESVGEGVEHLRVGDRVMAYQAWGCGYCSRCATGRSNLCANRKIVGKADRYQKEYSVMPEAVALPLPDELTFDDGVMLSCAGGTAWAGLRKVQPSCDDAVVVFGLGPVGLMAVFWAKAMGAYVIGVEVVPRRLDLGQKAGADVVVDARAEDPVARVKSITRGEGARVGVEASGSKAAQQQVLDATHPEARLVYIASAPEGKVIDPRPGRGGGLGMRAVHGSYTYSMGDYYDMLRALLLHGLHPGVLVTHRFSIEEADEAFQVADSCDSGKVILEWPQEG